MRTRGRPQSDKTKKQIREQELIEVRRKHLEDMLKNSPEFLKNEPFPNELMDTLLQSNGDAIEKELIAGYSHRPLIPPNLIFALNDDLVSVENVEKYQRYFNAPKRGAQTNQDNACKLARQLVESNHDLLARLIPHGKLTVNGMADKIESNWSERGIDVADKPCVRTIRRWINTYLEN